MGHDRGVRGLDLDEKVAYLSEDVVRLTEQVRTLREAVTMLVTKAEFAPVKLIAYGLATAVMSSVIMAILAKVIIK
jgi:hypothetical protein